MNTPVYGNHIFKKTITSSRFGYEYEVWAGPVTWADGQSRMVATARYLPGSSSRPLPAHVLPEDIPAVQKALAEAQEALSR